VIYLYETFRSNRSSIINNYNKKYPSRELTVEEQKLLYLFIKENNNKTKNFSRVIDFIQKENFNKNETKFSVIRNIPKYFEIDESLKLFFISNNDKDSKNNDFAMFIIHTLFNIYNLIKFICWKQFKNNLNSQYQIYLEDDIKNTIKIYFETAINENILIKKQDIADAVRRLISRHLSGKRGDTGISE